MNLIKIEKTDVFGWEAAIRGMRNPMNSWDNSDSEHKRMTILNDESYLIFTIGKNDLSLMKKLSKAGTDHGKFMRMINVTCDITAPLYWWKEYDTYKVGTVANSCSTMHKIQEEPFDIENFSIDDDIRYMKFQQEVIYGFEMPDDCIEVNECLIPLFVLLEQLQAKFNKTKDKKYWRALIQLLPSSYNQKRTVQLNYAVLKNMYHSRKNHKLDEWHDFCHWIEKLPHSELITGKE